MDEKLRLPILSPQDLKGGTIDLIGCGATGSHVGVLLAQLGFSHMVHLFDDDKVEDRNIMNQAYKKQHVGMKKVEALSNIMRLSHPEGKEPLRFDGRLPIENYAPAKFVFLLIDTIEGRKAIVKHISAHRPTDDPSIVIETRLSRDLVRVYTFSSNSTATWEESLPTNLKDDSPTECNAEYPTPIAPYILAGLAVNEFVTCCKSGFPSPLIMLSLTEMEVIVNR